MKDIFLVDADDTILDFHGASKLALKAAFSSSGIKWKAEYLPVFREVNDGFWQALERKELTRAELMERRFPSYLARLGLHEVDGAAFNQRFIEHLATHPIYMEGAETFLRELGKLGRVYIVTNGTAWIQKSRFEISGLNGYATDVFVSDKIGFDKPAKEFTDYVLAHIPNLALERAIWIGDSLSADVQAANQANMTSIWFNPRHKKGNGKSSPTYESDNFKDILQIIRGIS